MADNNAEFRHTAGIFSFANNLGYAHRLKSGLMASMSLHYDIDTRYTHAEGNLTNETAGGYIPFDYTLAHALNHLHLRGSAAFSAFGIPAGLRVSSGFQNTLLLGHHFEFTKGTMPVSSERTAYFWRPRR
jgi:hypothetical protein